MAKKKKGIGASFRQQVEQVPVVQQKAPRTISTNVSTGGGGLGSSFRSATKTATQKAEEERSARMRQGLSKTFSSVVRASFNNQRNLQPTTVQKGLYSNLRNQLAPVKHNADYTRSQQTKFLSTDLQRKGLNTPMSQLMAGKTNVGVEQGKALRAGMPTNSNVIESWRRTASDAEKKAREKYGYAEDFNRKQITERLDNSGRKEVFDPSNGQITTALPARLNTVAPNEVTYKAGDALRGMRLDDIRAGFADAFARKNVEDTAQRQYGITVDDDTQARLDAQRETLGYGTGMAAGQMAQYALTRGLLSGAGLVGRGAKAADTAGKAFRAEMAIDQAASVPLNLIDAMKEDNLEGIIRRFGLNQGLDLVFGAFTEGISIKRNPLYQNAETKHIAAKEARQAGDNAAANALDQSAKRDLDAISNAELDEARNDIVARVGEQRRIVNDANVDAIQNANGISAGTLNGADALDNIDNRAVRSIENMGYESDIPTQSISQPSESIAPRRLTPQSAEQSARIQNALNTIDQYGGLDRMLRTADDTDRLIRTFQDPAFNDVDMLEGVANNLFPEGKMRSIRIDAERAYSNDVRAFDADPESFDFIQPVREDYYIDLLSKEVVDELQRSRNVRDIIPQLADDLGVSEEELLDALRRTEGEFYGYAPSEGVRNARTVVENAPVQNFDAIADARDVYQNAVKYYDDLIADLEARGDISNETLQWLRARRNATDKARLKAGKNLKSADEYVDRFAKDIDYVRDRIYKTDGYDIFERHSVGKANEEIRSALSEMNERLTPINGRRQPAQMVTKESASVVPNESTVRRPNRQIKEGDVSSSLLRNLGYDGVDEVASTADNAAREATQQTARAAEKSAEVPKAKSQVEKPKSITTRSELEAETLKPNHKEIEQKYDDLIKKVEDDFYDVDYLEKYVKDNNLYVDNNAMKPRKDRLKSSVIGNLQRKKRDDVLIPLKDRTTDSLEREERFLTYDNYAAYSDSDQYRLGKVRDELRKREPKTEKTRAKSSSAWDDIPNVAKADEEPQDLVKANPHRKENTIPKASDQKTRKEVLFRGETADRNGAKETAEQVAEAPKKRNQVKGVLGEEKPKTEYSDMSTAELQAQRHRFEDQARYDANPGTSEDEILKIDEEFARRGETPNWFNVEPEQGGKKVRSPIEARRENDELVEKYGEFNNGTTKKVETEDGVKRNSKSIDTMLKDVSPETEHVVLNNMLDGDYARDGKTVREFVEEVNNHLAENPEAYMEKLANFGEKLDPRERLVGVEVAQAYAKNIGNVEYENKMVEAYMKIVPEAASLLKIHGILKKMSKPARKDYIEQAIAKFEKRFAKRLKKAKIDHLSLSEETREAIINAKTSEQTSKAWAKASVEIWNQIPASGKEKADFIRINAMLLNPKTHIRNVLGNAIFKPMREMKNITGTGLEFFFEKVGKLGGFEKVKLDKSARTKALVPDRQGMDYAAVILKENGDAIRGISKYIENLADGRPFDNGARLWMAGRQNGNPIINGFRKFADGVGDINSWALEHEDFHYFDKAFKTQYGRAMKARGLTLKDLVDNPRLSDEITEVATHEALRATYRDESAAARIISKWKNPGENAKPMRKAAGLALDSILPFTKTPINILRRAIDYSPVGAGKGIYHLVRGFHDGNQKMVVQGIDQLASAIPGSGLGMLGWFLAENDGVTAKLGSDKEDQFMKDLGKQNFSIVFNSGTDKEFSYTVDWAAPGCIPFFTGVALNEMSENRLDFWEAADALEQMLEPMTEMSVMQGIKNTLETFQRESGGGVMQGLMSVGINTGLSYVGQFKPTLVSQTARMIDPVRRDTTSTAESATKRQIERWINKQKAGIPGLSQTLNPYQNVWGEEEKNTYNDSIPLRILENYFSPGYAKANKADDVDKELLNIYKKDPTASSVLPAKYSQYEIGFDGGTVRFSYDDRSNFIKVQGKVSKQDLRKLFDTQEYKDASLTEKQKMIANVYSDAKGEAKRDTLLKMGKDEWKVYTDDFSGRKTEYQDAKDADLKAKQYYDYMTTKDWDLDESGKPVKSELVLYLNKQDDLSDEQRAVIFSKLASGNTKNPYEDGTAHTTDWQAEYDKYLAKKNKDKDGSSSSKSRGGSKKGRSGRRSGGGGGSSKTKARAKTASEKRFAALQKMKAPTTGKGIEALSQGAKGLTKAQKKALLKLMQKKLEV